MVIRSLTIVAALWMATISQAAVTQVKPNILGTNNNPGAWADNIVNTAHMASGGAFMTYQETWNSPTCVSSIIVEGNERLFGGEVWVATLPGGPFDTKLADFSAPGWGSTLVNVPTREVYGVKVIVNQGERDYYQVGEVTITSVPLGPNLAAGLPTVWDSDHTNPSLYHGGSVTDSIVNSSWRADPYATENWVGFEVPDGGTIDVDLIRVLSSSQHGTTWVWRNFDVQIKVGGVWQTSLIPVTIPDSEGICWVDFGEVLTVQGIRLYGSTAGGNNPTANDGKFVDEIMAFNTVAAGIPEPATMSLLALGGLAMLRRRK